MNSKQIPQTRLEGSLCAVPLGTRCSLTFADRGEPRSENGRPWGGGGLRSGIQMTFARRG